jgi:uncharacterized membrane protein YedE/YeeE
VIPFSVIFALGVSAFVMAAGCRDRRYSLVDLFLFAPLWVFAGYYCSFWMFLGCLMTVGSMSAAVEFCLQVQCLWLPWGGVVLGSAILVSVLLTRCIVNRSEYSESDTF